MSLSTSLLIVLTLMVVSTFVTLTIIGLSNSQSNYGTGMSPGMKIILIAFALLFGSCLALLAVLWAGIT